MCPPLLCQRVPESAKVANGSSNGLTRVEPPARTCALRGVDSNKIIGNRDIEHLHTGFGVKRGGGGGLPVVKCSRSSSSLRVEYMWLRLLEEEILYSQQIYYNVLLGCGSGLCNGVIEYAQNSCNLFALSSEQEMLCKFTKRDPLAITDNFRTRRFDRNNDSNLHSSC